MRVTRLPLVGWVFETGADDRVFDALLLAGPLVVVLLAVLGRSPLTQMVAAGYVVAFVVRTLVNAVQ